MIKAFFASKKWFLWAYGGGLFLLTSLYAQVYMTVLINKWYGRFYDLLQVAVQRAEEIGVENAVAQFSDLLVQFFWIAIPYVLLATLTGYFTRIYAFRWREAITFGYVDRWRNVQEEIEGASQRIQEDTYRFARIVESLGLQVVRSIMTLIAFIPILWQLSLKHPTNLPILCNLEGYLVWIAVGAAVLGLGGSWLVGIKLPGLEYNNQKVEAAYRKELVFGEDNKRDYVAPVTIRKLFNDLRYNYHRLFLHYGYFDVWLNLYDQIMIILPYLILGPELFTGILTLGVLRRVADAFARVYSGLAVFIHNWTTVTELRSIRKRLKEFQLNLDKYEITNEGDINGE